MASHNIVPSLCSSEEDVTSKLKSLLLIPGNVEEAANLIVDSLVEDLMLALAFECHQLSRLGEIPVMSKEDAKHFTIFESNETDIFGQQYAKTSPDCCCPICNRLLSASKFAPHLGKCLGMGRNSSRIASKRIANNCKENAYGGTSDDEDEY